MNGAGHDRSPTGSRTGRLEATYAAAHVDVRSPMPLWLTDLLDDPGLGAELVAGHDGVDARGPIRWAHISEIPDPTPWLEGGELLLTTGLGVRDSPDLQRRLVHGLVDRGAVAVGFGIGVFLDEVPVEMLRACDERALPLFTIPYEIPFIAVSRRVAHHAFEQHYATLRRAVDLHRQVLSAVVGAGGIDGVLAIVARAMPSAALVALDFSGRQLARIDPSGIADGLDAATLFGALPRDQAPRGRFDHAGLSVRHAAVSLQGHLDAFVVAVSERPLLEHEELLFEQGLAGVTLELARNRSVREAHRSRVDELFEDVLAGRATTETVAHRLARLGVDELGPHVVLAVDRVTPMPDGALCALVEDALAGASPPLVGRVDGLVCALVRADVDAAERIVQAADRRGWRDTRVGRSRTRTALDALHAAIREARVAVRLDGPVAVNDVSDLGLDGLLAGIREDLGTETFVAQVLGPVVEHDRREKSRLVDTLRAYLAHGCRPGPAAEELCIHRHTLGYRLDRIRDLTGHDPRAGTHLVEFGLALALHDRSGT